MVHPVALPGSLLKTPGFMNLSECLSESTVYPIHAQALTSRTSCPVS